MLPEQKTINIKNNNNHGFQQKKEISMKSENKRK